MKHKSTSKNMENFKTSVPKSKPHSSSGCASLSRSAKELLDHIHNLSKTRSLVHINVPYLKKHIPELAPFRFGHVKRLLKELRRNNILTMPVLHGTSSSKPKKRDYCSEIAVSELNLQVAHTQACALQPKAVVNSGGIRTSNSIVSNIGSINDTPIVCDFDMQTYKKNTELKSVEIIHNENKSKDLFFDAICIKENNTIIKTNENSTKKEEELTIKKQKKMEEEEIKKLPFVHSQSFMETFYTLFDDIAWVCKTFEEVKKELEKLAEFEERFAVKLIFYAKERKWKRCVFDDTKERYDRWKKWQSHIVSENKPAIQVRPQYNSDFSQHYSKPQTMGKNQLTQLTAEIACEMAKQRYRERQKQALLEQEQQRRMLESK